MFGWQPRLPVDFVFPTFGSNEAPMREASIKHVDKYVASIWDRLRTALWEAQAQSMAEACWQKQYYNRKMGGVNLKPGDLILVKADAFKGKRKIKYRWWRGDLGGGASDHDRCPLLQSDEPTWKVMCPPPKQTSSPCIRGWCSLVYGQQSCMGQVYQSHPMQDYLCKRWKEVDATREQW